MGADIAFAPATGKVVDKTWREHGRMRIRDAARRGARVRRRPPPMTAEERRVASRAWQAAYDARWILTAASAVVLGAALAAWFRRDEIAEWVAASWIFAKQILPLLFAGVFVAGVLLGRPGEDGLIPSAWVSGLVGGNSLGANFFAAVAGALMYFATLTEVPILQGLIGAGMGKGPALALLLAGPALSLPSMIVLGGILGVRKTVTYVLLVVFMSTATGLLYGWLPA